jgi:hypothetical protein
MSRLLKPRGHVSQTAHSTIPLFEKCLAFTKVEEVKAQGLYPYFKPISESEDTVVVIEGKKRIMLGSNNYLGLTHHPKVLEAATRALHRYGSGCTGSRFLNGSLDLHVQLEAALSEFLGKDDCIVFSTGYGANLGLISAGKRSSSTSSTTPASWTAPSCRTGTPSGSITPISGRWSDS